MAPHHAVDNHHSMPSKPPPHSVTKNNAGKPAPAAPYKRDLQSAMHNAPQVRVIHIFAPKVIKTDVANFRSTVQKLTGRSKRRTPRETKAVTETSLTVTNSADGLQTMAQGSAAVQGGPSSSMGYPVGLWEKEELQRLVGDACGVTDLVRCDSVDSATYSLDSGNTVFSGDSNGVDTSPTDSFSFYPQRETPYSLNEIPAPFFGLQPHDMHSVFNPTVSMPMSMPMSGSVGLLPEHGLLGSLPTSHVMDQNMSMLGFDVDSAGALPLPALSDMVPLGCNSISSSSSSGSLFDVPRHHCRLSVQQPYQGANFFESM